MYDFSTTLWAKWAKMNNGNIVLTFTLLQCETELLNSYVTGDIIIYHYLLSKNKTLNHQNILIFALL